METSLMIRHTHRFVRGEVEEMNEEWKMKNEEEKERFRIYVKIIQSFTCPICKDISPNRVIICHNGHYVCKECHIKTPPRICCICRQSIMNPIIPLRGMEDIVNEILVIIQNMIHFQIGERLDVCIHQDDEAIWKEGRVLSIDYDCMSFLIQVGKKMINRCFFSSNLAMLYTHTTLWRSIQNLSIGKKMEIMIERERGDTTWVPGVIIFRDLEQTRIHVVYRESTDDELQFQSFCIYSSLSIAIYPTFLDGITDWIQIE